MAYTVISRMYGRTFVSKKESYDRLVNFLSSRNGSEYKYGNAILAEARKNDENELITIKITDCDGNTREVEVPKTYKYEIRDSHGKIVFNQKLIDDVVNHKYVWRYKNKYRKYKSAYKGVRFRVDPVPFVHHIGGGGYYRNISYGQAKRLAADPETAKFNRPSRNLRNLPDVYDLEPVRDCERNWKSQGKCRKQWEHRLNSKKSATYVVKGFNKRANSNLNIQELADELIG